MILVGFGTEMVGNQLVRFWIMRNSHGDEWGNNGYARFNRARIHNRYLVDNRWQARGISYTTEDGKVYLPI
jgi:C1A family cysteine protease